MTRRIASVLLISAFCLPPAAALAWGERQVQMRAVGPTCGLEVVYRRTYAGKKTEVYAVHVERVNWKGTPAYQSISVYDDRVRRITMRESDLTPLAMTERWTAGGRLIERTYQGSRVRAVRKNLPDPMDVWLEVPPGVHDPESFAFLLRGYPFSEQDTVAPIQVLVADPNPVFTLPRTFGVLIVPQGVERITVPAGTFNCYRLEMTLAGVLGYLVPDNSFWLLQDDPHLIVKAEGAGETVELMAGPFPCDGQERCRVGADLSAD